MPQGDAETRELLLEILNELKEQVKDHDKRIRRLELHMARALGAIGVVTAGVAILRHL